jgi:ElaB/YqjD/DUF883 family membrane-anchored ribosome-binding protein
MITTIAEDMKKLTEDIIISHDLRVKTIGDLVSHTHDLMTDARKTVKGFAADKKKMAGEQAKDLTNFVNGLSKDVQSLLKKAQDMVKEFSKSNSQVSKEQAKNLANFVNELTKSVGSMLNGFEKDRDKMSKDLKNKLAKEVKDIQTEVKRILNEADKLIGEYGSEMSQARKSWKEMSKAIAMARKSGVIPRIETREKVTTGEQAIGKNKGIKKDAEKRKSNR